MRSADDSVRVLPEGDLPGGARADGTDLSGGECADPPMRDGEPGRAEQPNDASAEVLPNAPCQLQGDSAAVFPRRRSDDEEAAETTVLRVRFVSPRTRRVRRVL